MENARTERTGEERKFSLQYERGEEVREGDRVRFRDAKGVAVVVKVIRPGAKERGEYGWACPKGGVLVEGPPFGLVAQGDLDEIVFVGRCRGSGGKGEPARFHAGVGWETEDGGGVHRAGNLTGTKARE